MFMHSTMLFSGQKFEIIDDCYNRKNRNVLNGMKIPSKLWPFTREKMLSANDVSNYDWLALKPTFFLLFATLHHITDYLADTKKCKIDIPNE